MVCWKLLCPAATHIDFLVYSAVVITLIHYKFQLQFWYGITGLLLQWCCYIHWYSGFLNSNFNPSFILFVKKNRRRIIWFVCCYVSTLKLSLYDLVSCCITLFLHLAFTSFHIDFSGFPYENHLVKIGFVVLMIYG